MLCPRYAHNFASAVCEKTWLSTSQMLTHHFPFHSDSFFIAHSPTSGNEDCTRGQDGVYPNLFSGCQATLSF